ncbi:EthD family reductase [Nocardioides zeae]|uniref:EthD family reductase n=1 Tax=Nocardioides imazamoxiresistens TaxID=3231893 RepID=A0ABU3PZ08_9ACTN|nr:EthD family reductase [Nocardioides zeae]MDT9594111.1 EthD family reductase [Nocardioides zeae]
MHRITVQYAPPASEAEEEFERRYREEHVPLVHDLPGLVGFSLSWPQPLAGEKLVHLVAQLDFASAEDLGAALRSEQMAAAGRHAASLGVPATMFAGEVEVVAGG